MDSYAIDQLQGHICRNQLQRGLEGICEENQDELR
jgi:hypothetical protein